MEYHLKKRIYLLSLLCIVLISSCKKSKEKLSSQNSANQALADKPNIIIIYTDDQSQEDIGYFRKLSGLGSPTDSTTPNIDKLAKDGIAFNQFYTAAPVCTPSRAALLTGKKPESAGLIGNAYGDKGLKAELNMATYFRSQGYQTALIGKWHLGHTEEFHPNKKGFDRFFGHLSGVVDNYTYVYRWPKQNPKNHAYDLYENTVLQEQYQNNPNNRHLAHLLMDKAKEYITQASAPLFMYYAINQPHYPVQPLEIPNTDSASAEVKAEAYYQAFVKTIDTMVGRLINDLEAAGKLDNTIIVFQSDHGHSFESRNWDGIDATLENKGTVYRNDTNYSYRSGKFSTFEGGIRVPAIIRFPKKPKFDKLRGIVREGMAVSIDWFPTLAALVTQEPVPSNYDLEGFNLIEHMKDNRTVVREKYFWHHFGRGFAYRDDNLKLLYMPVDSVKGDNLAENYLPGYYLVDLDTNLKEDLQRDLKATLKADFTRMRQEALELYKVSCSKVSNRSCGNQDLLTP